MIFRRMKTDTISAAMLAAALAFVPAGAGAQKAGGGGGVQSLSKGSKGPIKIQSDSLELRDKDKTATFIDNVKLFQDDTTIECKVLVVHYEDDPSKPNTGNNNNRSRAPRFGQGGDQQISRVEAKGGVVLTQKDQVATGDYGVYDVKANTFVMTGNVVLTQGPNVVRGERLWVDLNTNVSRIESAKSGAGRVQGLFHPNAAEKDGPKPSPPRPLRSN